MKLVVICFVAVLWLQLPLEGEGECCYQHKYNTVLQKNTKRCDDCQRPSGFYCGVGDCNIFGCNCDRGCRTGNCQYERYRWRKREVSARISDAHDVIRAADVDGDGRMSLQEARLHLANTGVPTDRVKRSMMELDADNDEFLSAEEID